jgi:Polyketide cyclase / dehydrase and lipid transport
MKLLKKLLLWLIIIVVAVSVGAQFLPSKWKISREITINAPAKSIYPHIASMKAWPTWDAFDKMDPEIVNSFSGAPIGVGSANTWVSKKIGNGSGKITAADMEKGVSFELIFAGYEEAPMQGSFAFSAEGNATKVVYSAEGVNNTRNPLPRIMGQLMEMMVGKPFEQSLANLKAISEKK